MVNYCLSCVPSTPQFASLTPFSRQKPQHKVSWRHPCLRHWHQLDLILVRLATIKNGLHTRSYHSADCDTDHFLNAAWSKEVLPFKKKNKKKQGSPALTLAWNVSARHCGKVCRGLSSSEWYSCCYSCYSFEAVIRLFRLFVRHFLQPRTDKTAKNG